MVYHAILVKTANLKQLCYKTHVKWRKRVHDFNILVVNAWYTIVKAIYKYTGHLFCVLSKFYNSGKQNHNVTPLDS